MLPHSPPVFAAARLSTMQAFAPLPATKKLILVVIDGLTADVFEDATESGAAPTLTALAEVGTYARATSSFLAHPRLRLASRSPRAAGPTSTTSRTSSGTTAASGGSSRRVRRRSARCAPSARGRR